jgi:ATP-dependent helicase/DNAse subunit B
MDGILDRKLPAATVPGLTPEWPISVTGLKNFLGCPFAFFCGEILGWEKPAEAPSVMAIDSMSFGSLVHDTAAAFTIEHGRDFSQKEKDLKHWLKVGRQKADEVFEEFLRGYPLVGKRVIENERTRFLDNFESFLRHDFETDRPREFFAAEWSFGWDDKALLLEITPNLSLYIKGRVDRIDVSEDHTLVWDLKTGKSYPRWGNLAAPDCLTDIQLAVYGMAVQQFSRKLKIPGRIRAAYIFTDPRGEKERGFKDDFEDLAREAREWLKVCTRLLSEQKFPRTPDSKDCQYCYLQVLCSGTDFSALGEQYAAAGGSLADFYRFKFPGE